MATDRQKQAYKRKQISFRKDLWEEVDDAQLWDRNVNKGFVSIPVSMSLIHRILDNMSSGQPLSSTYLALWCKTWDSPLVEIQNEQYMAFHSGFSGQRAVTTWRQRMKKLEALGFIKIKAGPYGDYSFVLLLNPHLVIKAHQENGNVNDEHYSALLELAHTRKFAGDFGDNK